MSDLAVVGASVDVQAPESGTVTILSAPSTTVRAGGAFAYRGPIQVLVVNAVGLGGTCTAAAGVGVINPTANKVWADGQFVAREGDTGVVTVTGVTAVSAPCSFPVTVEITNAGQGKVNGA